MELYEALDEREYLSLETALYRLCNLRATDEDRSLISGIRRVHGDKSVRDILTRISAMPVFYAGDKVFDKSGTAGVIKEVDCNGPYWYQKMPASNGGYVEETFTPAWSVIVQFEDGNAFCHRETLTKIEG